MLVYRYNHFILTRRLLLRLAAATSQNLLLTLQLVHPGELLTYPRICAELHATDALVISHVCGTLSVLRFSGSAARFVTVQRVTVAVPGVSLPRCPLAPDEPLRPAPPTDYLVGVKAAADPLGRAVALAAQQQRVAVFFASAYADPDDAEAMQHAKKVRMAHPLVLAPHEVCVRQHLYARPPLRFQLSVLHTWQ